VFYLLYFYRWKLSCILRIFALRLSAFFVCAQWDKAPNYEALDEIKRWMSWPWHIQPYHFQAILSWLDGNFQGFWNTHFWPKLFLGNLPYMSFLKIFYNKITECFLIKRDIFGAFTRLWDSKINSFLPDHHWRSMKCKALNIRLPFLTARSQI